VALLAEYLCRKTCRDIGRTVHLSPGAIIKLKSYSWPGNVRELDNVIFNAIMVSPFEVVGPESLSLPETQLTSSPSRDGELPKNDGNEERGLTQKTFERAMFDFERDYFSQILKSTHGNKAAAARSAGMDRTVLYDHLRKVGLVPHKSG
jgi:DNA-binding NtrC family response regulator